MSISGIGSSGAAYDFTNMTPQQLVSAGAQLFKEGKISERENVSLMGLACAYVPISGVTPSVDLGLDSTIRQNYVQMLQNVIQSEQSHGTAVPGQLAADQGLLQVMEGYQNGGGAAEAQQSNGTIVNRQA